MNGRGHNKNSKMANFAREALNYALFHNADTNVALAAHLELKMTRVAGYQKVK